MTPSDGPAAFEARVADWLSYEDARRRVLAHASPLEIETVRFNAAVGRALAVDLKAPRALPEHDNSAMDGFALLAADIEGATDNAPVELEIVGEALPGTPWPGSLGAGTAVRIMTGAAVPKGADSVVRVEHTDGGDSGRVQIRSAHDAGQNIRPAGEDMQAGDIVGRKGATLVPGHTAILTSTGHLRVPVHRRPVVALIGTGDELVSIAALEGVADDAEARAQLWKDRIVDSNTPLLCALVEEAGGIPNVVGIAKDTRESVGDLLDRVGSADAVVTTGGASMGTHDLLKRVLDERGFELDFWRARIRPGSPLSLGFLPRTGRAPLPLFGLPGNPASAFVTFELFVRPYLRRVAGHARVERTQVVATAAEPLRGREDLTVFLRVVLEQSDGRLAASLTGPQNSGLVSSLGRADGLARLDVGVGVVEPGDDVPVLLLRQA